MSFHPGMGIACFRYSQNDGAKSMFHVEHRSQLAARGGGILTWLELLLLQIKKVE